MSSDGFLHKYFLNNSGKRLHKWTHYFDIYERHLARFREKSVTMLEIGVHGGVSLEMWKAYLGPNSTIIGVDINPECKQHEDNEKGIYVYIGSQDDKDFIEGIIKQHHQLDIVLDDGSHVMRHMISSFHIIYEHVSADGIYVVEDTHTAYWPNFGGGVKREGSFMEFVKHKMDEINAVHSLGALPITKFTRSTDSITCYDSVVVFERRPQGHRQAPITASMQ